MEVLNGGQGLRAFYARFPGNRETQGRHSLTGWLRLLGEVRK